MNSKNSFNSLEVKGKIIAMSKSSQIVVGNCLEHMHLQAFRQGLSILHNVHNVLEDVLCLRVNILCNSILSSNQVKKLLDTIKSLKEQWLNLSTGCALSAANSNLGPPLVIRKLRRRMPGVVEEQFLADLPTRGLLVGKMEDLLQERIKANLLPQAAHHLLQ